MYDYDDDVKKKNSVFPSQLRIFDMLVPDEQGFASGFLYELGSFSRGSDTADSMVFFSPTRFSVNEVYEIFYTPLREFHKQLAVLPVAYKPVWSNRENRDLSKYEFDLKLKDYNDQMKPRKLLLKKFFAEETFSKFLTDLFSKHHLFPVTGVAGWFPRADEEDVHTDFDNRLTVVGDSISRASGSMAALDIYGSSRCNGDYAPHEFDDDAVPAPAFLFTPDGGVSWFFQTRNVDFESAKTRVNTSMVKSREKFEKGSQEFLDLVRQDLRLLAYDTKRVEQMRLYEYNKLLAARSRCEKITQRGVSPVEMVEKDVIPDVLFEGYFWVDGFTRKPDFAGFERKLFRDEGFFELVEPSLDEFLGLFRQPKI